LRLSPIFFSGYAYSCTVACCGYLTTNKKVLIYTTNITKVITKLHSFALRSKKTDNNNRSEISQRSEISLDTGFRNQLAWQIRYNKFCKIYKKIENRPAVILFLMHFYF